MLNCAETIGEEIELYKSENNIMEQEEIAVMNYLVWKTKKQIDAIKLMQKAGVI
jgi:hypothetical protein